MYVSANLKYDFEKSGKKKPNKLCLPVIITCALFLWGSYTYNYEFCYRGINSAFKKAAYMTIFNLLFIVTLALYIKCARDRKWMVPNRYKLPTTIYQELLKAYKEEEDDIIEEFCAANDIVLHMRTKDGVKRICYICKHIKPDRTYHCSKCNVCVRRMDHHCYFMNNCVGLTNFKYFILLILYTGLLAFFAAGTAFDYILRLLLNGTILGWRQSYLIIGIAIGTNLGLSCALLLYINLRLLGTNQATIEKRYKPMFASNIPMTYDKGCWTNYAEVCTNNIFLWLLPYNFVTNSSTSDHYEPQPLEITLKEDLAGLQE